MSVLVKGMKMPGNCEECSLKQYDEGYGDTVCPFSGVPTINIGRQVDCPIEEIPEPHGDLIDRDALALYDTLFPESKNDSGVWVRYRQVDQMINTAPAVIEKENLNV